MGLLPQSQSDQTKLAVTLIAGALAVFYYMYPYSTRATELAATRTRASAVPAQSKQDREPPQLAAS